MTTLSHITDLIEDLSLDDLVTICAFAMGELDNDSDHRRYTMLFAALQEHNPDTLDEFTLRFAERNTEKEDQDNG